MDASLVVAVFAVALIAGAVTGSLLTRCRYRRELGRIARLLLTRDKHSNERVTVEMGGSDVRELAIGINHQLDSAQSARITANRRASSFQRDLAALSHDIRTPLSGAKGYVQLAASEADPQQADAYLEAAQARLDDANYLVDQLFAYVKSLDSNTALDLRDIAVAPLLSRVLVGHYPKFEERGWQPIVLFEDETCTVSADEEALTRIFENLVSNALRHGAASPCISQRLSSDGAVEIAFENEVTDPGSLEVERLFDRFYRADASRRAGGSGLGLTTAAQLAHRMGFELSAELRPAAAGLRPAAAGGVPSVTADASGKAAGEIAAADGMAAAGGMAAADADADGAERTSPSTGRALSTAADADADGARASEAANAHTVRSADPCILRITLRAGSVAAHGLSSRSTALPS